mmetsp:Transcript_60774/g.159826  ORF Transcript_60774/g.159826 Transcript_60774/m.159826 type:complete len:393 (+) Transcript_60774:44-1222(+)
MSAGEILSSAEPEEKPQVVSSAPLSAEPEEKPQGVSTHGGRRPSPTVPKEDIPLPAGRRGPVFAAPPPRRVLIRTPPRGRTLATEGAPRLDHDLLDRRFADEVVLVGRGRRDQGERRDEGHHEDDHPDFVVIFNDDHQRHRLCGGRGGVRGGHGRGVRGGRPRDQRRRCRRCRRRGADPGHVLDDAHHQAAGDRGEGQVEGPDLREVLLQHDHGLVGVGVDPVAPEELGLDVAESLVVQRLGNVIGAVLPRPWIVRALVIGALEPHVHLDRPGGTDHQRRVDVGAVEGPLLLAVRSAPVAAPLAAARGGQKVRHVIEEVGGIHNPGVVEPAVDLRAVLQGQRVVPDHPAARHGVDLAAVGVAGHLEHGRGGGVGRWGAGQPHVLDNPHHQSA